MSAASTLKHATAGSYCLLLGLRPKDPKQACALALSRATDGFGRMMFFPPRDKLAWHPRSPRRDRQGSSPRVRAWPRSYAERDRREGAGRAVQLLLTLCERLPAIRSAVATNPERAALREALTREAKSTEASGVVRKLQGLLLTR